MAKTRVKKIKDLPEFEYRLKVDTLKNRDKCIKRIERLVRGSLEYRDLVFYLKEYMDFTKCVFFQNIDGKVAKTKVEIHHEPFSLYDIIDIVLEKYIQEGLPLNEFMIADEVMELHYKGMVGLVPLSITLHQMVHPRKVGMDPKLFVPIYLVNGDYQSFIKEYAPYISDSVYERFKAKVEQSKAVSPDTFRSLLASFEYIEQDGVNTLEKLEIPEEKNSNEMTQSELEKELVFEMAG